MEMPMTQDREIREMLRSLGIGRQYQGYAAIVAAMNLLLENEERLVCIKQGVLCPVGEMLECDWRTVERNIRTVIQRAWNVKPDQVQAMMGYAMDRPPTLTEFLDMMVEYIINLPSYQKRNGDRRSRRTPHMHFNRKG